MTNMEAIDRPTFWRRLAAHESGLAMLEFAFAFPPLLLMALGGAELANYTTTRMRVSQIALQVADNAARMGNGPQMAAKTIGEADVNDVFIGAQLQSGQLDLNKNGRVILSDLEAVANPNTNSKFKIGWQRCYGQAAHPSTYGKTGDTNLSGIGPADQLVTTQDDSATMFVEVFYTYHPLVAGKYAPTLTMTEVASMPVRDRRNLANGIQADGSTAASC